MRPNRQADSPPPLDGKQRLAVHVGECSPCQVNPPPLQQIATLLDASSAALDPSFLSARTLTRLRPQLERLANAAWWRRVAASLLWALLPLPAVLVYDAYALRLLYETMQAVLPAGVALYVLASYTAILSLLFALTYAAIPVLLARSAIDRRTPAT